MDHGPRSVTRLIEHLITLAPLEHDRPSPLHLYPSAYHGLLMGWFAHIHPPVTASDRYPLRRGDLLEPPVRFDLHVDGQVHRIAVVDVKDCTWPFADAALGN